ncbi:unnamed protein product [Rhodiola kirilowii]
MEEGSACRRLFQEMEDQSFIINQWTVNSYEGHLGATRGGARNSNLLGLEFLIMT